LLSERGEHLDQLAVPPDVDSLRTLAHRIEEVHRQPVCAVIESMSGARLVHDAREQGGWDVEIADGNHARADAYVSLAVIASALVVASGARTRRTSRRGSLDQALFCDSSEPH